jgi:hypothetical protein
MLTMTLSCTQQLTVAGCGAVCLQAQFVAALRAALKPGAAPALAVCGGTLATSFLSAGLAAGDGAVMRRLMDLLVAPLQVGEGALNQAVHLPA